MAAVPIDLIDLLESPNETEGQEYKRWMDLSVE
jgi:hypothetical protein